MIRETIPNQCTFGTDYEYSSLRLLSVRLDLLVIETTITVYFSFLPVTIKSYLLSLQNYLITNYNKTNYCNHCQTRSKDYLYNTYIVISSHVFDFRTNTKCLLMGQTFVFGLVLCGTQLFPGKTILQKTVVQECDAEGEAEALFRLKSARKLKKQAIGSLIFTIKKLFERLLLH